MSLRGLLNMAIGASIVVAGIWAAVWGLRMTGAQPLVAVDLQAPLSYVSAEALQVQLQPLYGESLASINVATLQNEIEALPWVRQASVQRRWPERLQLTIWEHVPVARWGAVQILTAAGDLIAPPMDERLIGLPKFDAPEAELAAVRASVHWLGTRLPQLGWELAELQRTHSGSWRIQLRDGPEIRYGPALRQRQLVLETLRGELAPRWDEIAYIDLRHANGLAVAYKPATAVNAVRGGG